MGFKRMTLEQSDGEYRSGSEYRMPQEYEMPTRGQSFIDGASESLWKRIAQGLLIIFGFLLLILFGGRC